MQRVTIPRKDGNGRDEVSVYNIEDFPYEKLSVISLAGRKGKNSRRYCCQFATFDIETTTIPGERPYGYMYIWQMTVAGECCIGRTWEEWCEFMKRVSLQMEVGGDKYLVCYVFNLAYEFQFIRDFLKRDFGGFEIFANATRKPITVRTGSNVEFRCAYRLTNMSLEKALLNELGVEHVKAVSDLDYKVVRTPSTELTTEELGYCVADVVGLHELITCRLVNEHDNLSSIPLTSTGYVRRDCRNASRKEGKWYRDFFRKMTITPEVYELLREAARGGDTHANRYMSGHIWEGADSFDIKSSYPFQLFREYPMSPYIRYGRVESESELNELLETKACLFRVAFYNIRCKKEAQMPYMPLSKCNHFHQKSLRLDNGRVLRCDFIHCTLLDIDYEMMSDCYEWDRMAVTDMHIAERGYLPECLTNQVMVYFRKKCELELLIKKLKAEGKDTSNEKYLYAKMKNRLNSIFGMCYQNPVMNELRINSKGEWEAAPMDVPEALKKFFSNRNNFLIYSWGCVCTAYGRQWLHRMRSHAGDTIYSDTDSCKSINADYEAMEKFNEEIKAWDRDRGCYVDIDGHEFYLGYVEKENDVPIRKFKTLGAKKYCYEDEDGLHITISGVDKRGKEELGCIENFDLGFTFTKWGGLTLYYNDDLNIHPITINGETFTTASNVGMVDSTYTIGLTEEYAELIGLNLLREIY
mgnify:CR=1 FL=1